MKSLQESLNASVNEARGVIPRNNIVYPATTSMGQPIVVIGNAFTIKDKAGWQKAFNLVKSIFPKSEIGHDWDSLDGVNGNLADCLDPRKLGDDGVLENIELVYAHNPEFLGNREGSIAVFELDDVNLI